MGIEPQDAQEAWQRVKDWVEKVAHFHVAQHQNEHRLVAMPDHIFAKVKADLQIAEAKVREMLDLPTETSETEKEASSTPAPHVPSSDQPAAAGTSSQESAAPTVLPAAQAPPASPAPTTPTSPAP